MLRTMPKWVLWIVAVPVALLLVLFVASLFIDEPLRRSIETKLNQRLPDYTIRLPGLRFQPIGLSITLKDLTISQKEFPDPPIAHIPYFRTSIHWREILSGKLVAELEIDRPKLTINLPQLRTETAKEKPPAERGWQQALEDIYPLKVNLFTIRDGDITYIDEDEKRPLHLGNLNVTIANIRNIQSPDQVYPSSFHVDAVIFGTGRGIADGNANFLAEPFPGVKCSFRLLDIPMDFFKPVVARSNVALRSGKASASGTIEYAPKIAAAHVQELKLSELDADYIHTAPATITKKKAAKVAKKTGKISNRPDLQLRLDQLRVTNSNLGLINRSGGNHYRVFLSDSDLHLTNLSNQFVQGPARAKLTGKFMGSGPTMASATFRPEKSGPDFDLTVSIKDTQLKSMNDLLRAYGNFDVTAGVFSFYSEIHVKNTAVTGYVKPLFRDLKVYDKRQDKEKGLFRKMYEKLVGGVSKLLENRPREEVATKADISGRLDEPRTSTLQIIVQLITNAFFRAILPGFEQEVSGQRR